MKIILLFDPISHLEWKKTYREYELNEDLTKHLKKGGTVIIEFCDPIHGEIMEAKKNE